MTLSDATKRITRALEELGNLYGFRVKKEEPLAPEKGAGSERVDVSFRLPDGRPVFRFEIDNAPHRVAHNRLKMFGIPNLRVPVSALAVQHAAAAVHSVDYTAELLSQMVLPHGFLGDITVPTSSELEARKVLGAWLDRVIADIVAAPQWGSVYEIAAHYQPLLANGALRLASAHLASQAALGWFLVRRGLLTEERAACLTVALARMLQRSGYHRHARWQLRSLERRVPNMAVLAKETVDHSRAIRLLLDQQSFNGSRSHDQLTEAARYLAPGYQRWQLLWRSAIPLATTGAVHQMESVLDLYVERMGDTPLAASNVALVRTLAAVHSGKDPRQDATAYAVREHYLLERKDGPPDGTIHGMITGLYLRTLAEMRCGNANAAPLLARIEDLRRNLGVPRTADGLREIASILPLPIDRTVLGRRGAGQVSLVEEAGRDRKDALTRLYSEVMVSGQPVAAPP